MSSRELCPFDPRTEEYQTSDGLPVLCAKKRPDAMRVVTQEELSPIEEFGRFRHILENIAGSESCGDTSAVFSFQKDTTLVTNGFVWGRRGPVTDTLGTTISLVSEGIQFSATRDNNCPDQHMVFNWKFVDRGKKAIAGTDGNTHEQLGELVRSLLSDEEWYVAAGEAGVCVSRFNHTDLLFFNIDPRQEHVGGEVLLFAEDVHSLSEALQG